MRSARVITLTCAALTVGALAATPASASFSAPFSLAPPAQQASQVRVAVNASGDAAYVWKRGDDANSRVVGQARSADGLVGPAQVLSPPGQRADTPAVAIEADGTAVFTWERFDGSHWRAQTRRLSSFGALGPVRTLSAAPGDAAWTNLGLDTSGNAVFFWELDVGSSETLQTRALSAAGVLSPVQDVSPAGETVDGPEFAVGRGGDAVYTWTRNDPGPETVLARARSAAGVLSPVQTVSGGGAEAFGSSVGVDGSGDAVFVWLVATTSGLSTYSVHARARSAAGTLSPRQNLSGTITQPASIPFVYEPFVGVDANGDAVFAWVGYDGANFRVMGRGRTAAGALFARQTISGPGEDATEPQLAVAANGRAVFAWRQSASPAAELRARVRDPDGPLFATQIVAAGNPDLTLESLAFTGAHAAVAWRDSSTIRASVGP